jgi:hypothetical protein
MDAQLIIAASGITRPKEEANIPIPRELKHM